MMLLKDVRVGNLTAPSFASRLGSQKQFCINMNVVQFLIGAIKQAIVLGAGTESKNSGLFFKVNY